MKLMRRAVLAVCLAALACGACWHCRARQQEPVPVSVLESGPTEASHVISRRLAKKQEVIDRLLAGELTLLEAAAWFRRFNDDPPDQPCDFRRVIFGASDGEKACRQVVFWARSEVERQGGPSQYAAVVARLERELEALAAKGAVELPW